MYREPLPIYAEYKDEIWRGRREGHIIYPCFSSSLYGPHDNHGHLPDKDDNTTYWRSGALRLCNTRPLSKEGKMLLRYFTKKGGEFRFIEIGHGTGHGCFDVHEELKASGTQGQIHSMGLTPVSPFRGLKENVIDTIVTASRNKALRATGFSNDLFEESIQDALWLQRNGCISNWRLRLDAALQLQAQFGQQIFTVLGHPFIDRQYIGRFGQIQLQEGTYDMVYEDRGYLRHGEDAFQERLEKVARLLNANGVLLFIDFWWHRKKKEMLEFLVDKKEYIVIAKDDDNIDEDSIYLLTRRDTDLGQKIIETIRQKEGIKGSETALHIVADLENFLEEIIPPEIIPAAL